MKTHLLLCVVLASFLAQAQQLRPQWTHAAGARLAAGPAAADLHPAPGFEVVLLDSGSGATRCLDTQGAVLWETAGTPPGQAFLALWADDIQEMRLVAVATGDGVLRCLDGASGQERWRGEIGPDPLGIAWTELDGDIQSPELLAAGRGVVGAFQLSGETIWRYSGEDTGQPLVLTGPPAVADIDGDHRAESFFTDTQGLFALDADGAPLWKTARAGYSGGAVVAGADVEGMVRVFACGADKAVNAFDAAYGDPVTASAVEPPERIPDSPVTSLALADLNHDGYCEVLVAFSDGVMIAADAQGQELWRKQIGTGGVLRLAVADLDSDSDLEIVATEGAALRALNRAGAEKWSKTLEKPVSGGPLILDADKDAAVNLLIASEDGALTCFSTENRFSAALAHWPAARYDAAQTAALPAAEILTNLAQDELMWEMASLLGNGGFDAPAGNEVPKGWMAEGDSGAVWSQDAVKKLGGSYALKVTPSQTPVTIVSEPAALPTGLRSVTALAMASGAGSIRAAIRWGAGDRIIREDELRQMGAGDGEWRRFSLGETAPPVTAEWVALALTTPPGDTGPAWWDSIQLNGNCQRIPRIQVLTNQAGYEVMAPKHFAVAASFNPREARFALVDGRNIPVYEGTLTGGRRIKGAYDTDWGAWFWRGDFSGFNAQGVYRVRVSLDQTHADGPPFEIGVDRLWAKTIRAACAAFRAQRCGVEVPGFHSACHLDDAAGGTSLVGGWHDGGGYGKTTATECLWLLVDAYHAAHWRIQRSPDLAQAMLEELLWGAAYLERRVREDGVVLGAIASKPDYYGAPEQETDNVENSGDERPVAPEDPVEPAMLAAALARVAQYAPEDRRPALIQAAARVLDRSVNAGDTNPFLFSAAMSLCLITGDPHYAALAKKLLPEPVPAVTESFLEYEDHFQLLELTTLVPVLMKTAAAMLKQTDPIFGVYRLSTAEPPNFFNTPETGAAKVPGNSACVLDAAGIVARAFRFQPLPENQTFLYDQLNWILGVNPFGLCLMEGAGSTHPPSYAHGYAAAGLTRGAVPGLIARGITGAGPGEDRPWFDLSGASRPEETTNGCSLRDTALYLHALCHLKRIHMEERADLLPD